MQNPWALGEGAVREILERGCCLGKYRVLVEGTYYCYLEGAFECRHQQRRRVQRIGADMLVCEADRQESCESCEHYKAAAVAPRA